MHPAVERFVAERGRPPRLLIFVAEDWHFCTHRLPLARAAVAAGYELTVMARVQAHRSTIEATGARVVAVPLARGGIHPLREWRTLRAVIQAYRSVAPDLVHHVAVKPVLYGAIAAWVCRVERVVNALAGLGYVFTSRGARAWGYRLILVAAFRRLLVRPVLGRLVLQNPDDQRELVAHGIVPDARIVLIRGSGVDLEQFRASPLPVGVPVVVLPGRMLWDKGVAEFVEASAILRRKGVPARFVLVGGTDGENPSSVPTEQLTAWGRSGVVECWGERSDMPEVLTQATIVCLPSYREGLPKALLEGAAAGRPLVATDVPGCREVVRDGVNGLLVPARDPEQLAKAIASLLADPERCARMGAAGRRMVAAEFSAESVAGRHIALYGELLAGVA